MSQQEQVEDEDEFEDGEVVTELNDNHIQQEQKVDITKETNNIVYNTTQQPHDEIQVAESISYDSQIQQQFNDVHPQSDIKEYGNQNNVEQIGVVETKIVHVSQVEHDDDEFEGGEIIADDIPQQQQLHNNDDEFEGGEIIADDIPQQEQLHDDDEFEGGEIIADDIPQQEQLHDDDDEFEQGEIIADDIPQQEQHNDDDDEFEEGELIVDIPQQQQQIDQVEDIGIKNHEIQEQIAEQSVKHSDDDQFEDGELVSGDPPDDDEFEDGEMITDDIPQQQHISPPDDDEFEQGEVISTPSTTNTTVVENAYYLTAQSDDDIKQLFQQTFPYSTPTTCQLNQDTYYVIEEPKLQDDHQHIQQLIESEQGQNASSQLKSMFLDQISNDYNLWINYTPYQCLIEQFQLHIETPVFEIQEVSDSRNLQDSPEKGESSPQSSGLISSHKALKSSIFFPIQEVQVKKISEAPAVDNILDLIPDYSYLLLQNIQIKE